MTQVYDCVSRLSSPLLLADFLTDSYNIGGVVSLLALNGIFLLMTQHHLDYPRFYPQVISSMLALTTNIYISMSLSHLNFVNISACAYTSIYARFSTIAVVRGWTGCSRCFVLEIIGRPVLYMIE